MGQIVGGAQPHPLRIDPNNVRPVMLDKIDHTRLQHLVRGALRQGEEMLRGILFLLVNPATFDTDSVNQKAEQRHRHLDFGLACV